MSVPHDNPWSALERVFHEPNRMAIISTICAADDDGVSFNELKEKCELTDGNLSRHLKTLEEAGIVRIRKTFVGPRPRTTVFMTNDGREKFVEYLDALETALKKAAKSIAAAEKESRAKRSAFAGKAARA